RRPDMRTKKTGAMTILQKILLFVPLAVFCVPAAAQAGRGGISGLVSDSSGAIIPGATVIASDMATGTKLTTTTTASGLFSFISLAPGIYDVSAASKGFETTVQKGVRVTLDQVSTVNLSLKVGSINEVVTVTESTALV